jgi:hypothetical protein
LDIKRLEGEFHNDMLGILEKEREVGFCSTRFRNMVETYGGVGAARRLLKINPEPMFEKLRNMGRLDLTMEFHVVMEKYRPLFSELECKAADWRLKKAD